MKNGEVIGFFQTPGKEKVAVAP